MDETFEEQLRQLINRECLENKSDTPDWILATYLVACLDAFNKGVNRRRVYTTNQEGSTDMREYGPVQLREDDCPCGCGGEYIPPNKKETVMEETTIFDDIRNAETIETAIAYAIGAASTSWSEGPRGEFMVDHANELANALKDRFEVLVRDAIKTTMAMTATTLKKG